MTITMRQFFLITCDICHEPPEWGDSRPCFETVEEARRLLDDWTIGDDGSVICDECSARQACAEQGHVFPDEWQDCRCDGRITTHRAAGCDQFRHCVRCGELALRPAPAPAPADSGGAA